MYNLGKRGDIMKKLFVLVTSAFLLTSVSSQVQAKNLVRVMAIGSSPRGQFVAFEEFGYQNGRKIPFSKIRVMNMWQNKYVTDPIYVIGNEDVDSLINIRSKAKTQAITQFKQFNISI